MPCYVHAIRPSVSFLRNVEVSTKKRHILQLLRLLQLIQPTEITSDPWLQSCHLWEKK